MPKPRVLRFGIQSLDRLIGTIGSGDDEIYGVDLSEPRPSKRERPTAETLAVVSSICLAGPDGTGKSVLSLHLASHYLADCLAECVEVPHRNCPKVFYISTDLTHNMAVKAWDHFELDTPFNRREPLVELKQGKRSQPTLPIIGLEQYFPSGNGNSEQSIVSYLEDYSPKIEPTKLMNNPVEAKVCFVDLASSTAGDDWGFVHRLLSTLEKPSATDSRHLVVLDAVEGFETLVGDLNAFGEKSSRRSRIAQVMRLAAGKCHVLMVVEEGHEQRFPEEFVTDVVIRLRNVQTGRYLRRTVEIEKARGQWHRRGQHPYVIRDGGGSTTGSQSNADDPEVFRTGSEEQHQSYVHVFPSLDYNSREIMISRKNPSKKANKASFASRDEVRQLGTDNPGPHAIPKNRRFAAFGLPYLDNMLGGKGDRAERDVKRECDTRGLACASATALIGDALTQKTQLGNAFLSRGFYSFAEEFKKRITDKAENGLARYLETEVKTAIRGVGEQKISANDVLRHVWDKVKDEAEQLANEIDETPFEVNSDGTGKRHSVAVLFTTEDIDVENLADDFYQWLREDESAPVRETESTERKSKRLGSEDEFLARMAARIERYAKEPLPPTGLRDIYRSRQTRFREDLVEKAFENELKKHIVSHTVCRRFEIHDLPAPVLMNIFQRGIEKAQRIVFRRDAEMASHLALPDLQVRSQESWRIRVVIDDLNAFRNTYPEMRGDPLMLPSLLFMLRREGVTSLILDTQASASPELPIAERFDTSVRELVQNRIYIWRLPFFGENRVAISVIPPISHEYRGLIRELREASDKSTTDRALTVDPHFELYMDLEKGVPQPVPLEVRLYADTPGVEKYVAVEEKLLAQVFNPIQKQTDETHVITPVAVNDYETLRDGCHLQRNMRLNHTMILQVNEFWWLRPPGQPSAGAFRPQWSYLNAATGTSKGDKYCSELVVDPFQVFQPTKTPKNGVKKTEKPNEPNETTVVKRRRDFFDDDCGYGLESLDQRDEQYVDRVPYTWDFGFLLCNAKAWNDVSETGEQGHRVNAIAAADNKVNEVWRKLRKATGNTDEQGQVSWKEFFEASKIVAEFQSFRTSSLSIPFDFTMAIPESFSCLILEMWLSESYDTLKKYEEASIDPKKREAFHKRRELLKDVGSRRWYPPPMEDPVTLLGGLDAEYRQPLQDILKARTSDRKDTKIQSFSLELYKVWLLLTEVIDFSDLVDPASHLNFEFKSREVTSRAVSARHWYKSASKFIDSLTPEQIENNWIPVRLPGHFSARADWFLAVAGGSRSSRLANHALDLLSSKRSNITRLQEGVGLPTRKLFGGDGTTSHLRTRLISAEKGKPLENIEYDVLRRVGASLNDPDQEFYWLWRSGIWAYNRHSRIWHKWLNRALLWWNSWRQRYESDWKSGFEVYRLLNKIEFPEDKDVREQAQKQFDELNLKSWHKFHELRDILIAELRQVSIASV